MSEVPEFAVGGRDLVFVANNGEVGNPLVGGARGRIQLLASGEAGDGVSQISPGPTWVADIADEIRQSEGEAAESLDADEPFVFDAPRPATREDLERMQLQAEAARAQLMAPTEETETERAERLALQANGFNPVLPR